jgi:hypothetical protein
VLRDAATKRDEAPGEATGACGSLCHRRVIPAQRRVAHTPPPWSTPIMTQQRGMKAASIKDSACKRLKILYLTIRSSASPRLRNHGG